METSAHNKVLTSLFACMAFFALVFASLVSPANTYAAESSAGEISAQSEDLVDSESTGTCTWYLYKNGELVIRPTNGVSGQLSADGQIYPTKVGPRPDDPNSLGILEYYKDIKTVRFDPGVSVNKNATDMFKGFFNVTSIDLTNLDTSNMTNAARMFKDCKSLKSVNFSGFDTSRATSLNGMFENCTSLVKLDASKLKLSTSSAVDIQNLFKGCTALDTLDISGLNTSKAAVAGMFNNCKNLSEVKLGGAFTFKGNAATAQTMLPSGNWKRGGTSTSFTAASLATKSSIAAGIYTRDEMRSLTKATITLSATSYTYDGTAKKPSVTVKLAGKTLKAGTDYAVTYSNNTNAGTATALLISKGGYTDSRAVIYKIDKRDISKASISVADQAYSGSALKPSPVIKVAGLTLKAGTDFSCKYKNNLVPGTASVTITAQKNFSGTVTKTFSISKKNISGATVTVANRTYSGAAQKPAPVVKLGSKTLKVGTDYTLSYKNNTNAGSATITLTGKGYLTGTKKVNFTIAKKSLAKATVSIASQAYTSGAIKPVPMVKLGSKTLKAGTDFTVTYQNNTNVGTATATITGKGNYTGKLTKTFKITKRAISKVEFSKVKDQLYTGSAIKPALTLKCGGKTLKAGTHYTIAYKNNKKIGTATITVTGKGSFTGTKTITFKIAKGTWLKSSGKWWYKHPDGSYTKNAWEKIDGKYYHFNSKGYMQTGWLKVGKNWYYLESSGARAQNKWVGDYYFQADGIMAKNKWIGNYYVGKDGKWVKNKKK